MFRIIAGQFADLFTKKYIFFKSNIYTLTLV